MGELATSTLSALVAVAATQEDSVEPDEEDIKAFLREPPYIILMVIIIFIFIAMWFVSDLPPHGAKKTKK